MPATADFALASASEFLRKRRRKLRLLIPNSLVAEHEATDLEHLGQITQAEFVA
jgi:hypothetical protein